MKKNCIYSGIFLAAVLWFVMFVFQPFNFWLMMSISTSLLAILAIIAYGKTIVTLADFSVKNITIGIVSAAALYGIFWVGNFVMRAILHRLSGGEDLWLASLSSVYGNAESLPLCIIGLLLFFPIGCFEELFWRGAVQRYFQERFGGLKSLFLTVLIYTAIHLATGNIPLILAAFTCGLFWGAIYWKTKSIVPVLISHMLWDPVIFTIFPIR